jgi:tetratricopeptide (TPR) repeat protein
MAKYACPFCNSFAKLLFTLIIRKGSALMCPLRIKKTSIGLIVLLYTALNFAESFDKLSTLYNEKKYNQFIGEVNILLKEGKEPSLDLLSLLGRAYVDIGNPKEAIPHLRNVIKHSDKVPNWMNAWSLYYLSKAFASMGQLDSARMYLDKTIETNATKNVVQAAKMDLINLGLNPMFEKWQIKETVNFKFYFPKNSKVKDFDAFTKDKQEAFDTINSFFNAILPKKIDFYVWNKTIDYDKRNRKESGFAIPELSIIHTRYFQTRGHEMTHVISYHSIDNIQSTSFVNEGIATYFDLSNGDKMSMAQKARKECKIPIIELWRREDIFRSVEQGQAYSIAAAFVGKLLNTKGKDKFMQLLANQTYENAITIYGAELDAMIKEFEEKLES